MSSARKLLVPMDRCEQPPRRRGAFHCRSLPTWRRLGFGGGVNRVPNKTNKPPRTPRPPRRHGNSLHYLASLAVLIFLRARSLCNSNRKQTCHRGQRKGQGDKERG